MNLRTREHLLLEDSLCLKPVGLDLQLQNHSLVLAPTEALTSSATLSAAPQLNS